MKPFSEYPSFVSDAAALDGSAGGASGDVGMGFPAPGVPQRQQERDEESSGNNTSSPPVAAFSGSGVVLGSSMPANMGTYTVQQNIRDVPSNVANDTPKGPNPLTQKSKLVQEHNAKNNVDEEAKVDSDDEEIRGDSQNSKNEDEELLDLS